MDSEAVVAKQGGRRLKQVYARVSLNLWTMNDAHLGILAVVLLAVVVHHEHHEALGRLARREDQLPRHTQPASDLAAAEPCTVGSDRCTTVGAWMHASTPRLSHPSFCMSSTSTPIHTFNRAVICTHLPGRLQVVPARPPLLDVLQHALPVPVLVHLRTRRRSHICTVITCPSCPY